MMTEPSTFTMTSSVDGIALAGYRWDPAGEPSAVVRIAHGMGEHAARYAPLAQALTAQGYVVYAQDHRGHGETLRLNGTEPGIIGPSGWSALVEDLKAPGAQARADHPGLSQVLIAHSMGSFAAQQYLPDHSEDLDALVLTGTGAIDLLAAGIDLDQPVDLTAFNAPFAPARTDYDWLSRDPAQVDLYVADDLCGFGLDLAGGKAMFTEAGKLAQDHALRTVRSSLPVLIAVGDADPVNAGLALVQPLVDRYRSAGLSDVTLQVYPGARHEIFNETNRDEVVADVVAWLGTHL